MAPSLFCLMIFIAVACAIGALLPQPNPQLQLPKMVLPEPSEPIVKLPKIRSRGRRHLSNLLSTLGKALPPFGRPDPESAQERLVYTGVNLTAEELRGVKVLAALGCALGPVLLLKGTPLMHPLVPLIGGMFGLVLPDLWVRSCVRRRQKAIVRLLPEVIDLLALCIGAGLDFLGALNRVAAVKSFRKEALMEELSIVLQEIKLGKRRFEALKSLAKRVNISEMSSFVRTLVQADRMGTPIAEVLAIHSEDIRFERFTRAERAALKAPIKILVPLIFCIMPCVALIVGAPIFLQFMKQNPFGK